MIDLVRYSLQFASQPIDLDIRPDPESLTILVIDPERPDDANPVANLVIGKEGDRLVLNVYDWREVNADEASEQTIVLYDLKAPQALPAPEALPGVLLHIDGGVVHDVLTNIAGLEVRAFDQDKFEECGPEDPDQGMIVYPIEHGSLNTEEDWARYRREEMGETHPDDDPDHDTMLNHLVRNGPWE